LHELVRTNNAVLITAIEALLKSADIPHLVLDQHMSVLEGSLGMLPRRIVVDEEHWDSARQLLQEAGMAHELRPDSSGPRPETTDDAVLGGRLRLTQMKRGHRVGHDAILLAAAVAARSGDRVVEFGAGVGAAGLAVAVRCPGVEVTLLERDAELAAMAQSNIERNNLGSCARAVMLDVTATMEDFAAHGLPFEMADHVLMNPPFNNASRQNVSPDPVRRAAHVAEEGMLKGWIDSAWQLLHPAGTLTLIWRADGLAEVLAVLGGRFDDLAVLPVHGRAGAAAIRILIRARKGTRGPFVLLPGLMLNDVSGKPTVEAEAVLRNAEALPLANAE
jgi:tRNA1(Val) A37 N6-methylase TrmN6